jgi:hypothetical protein
VAAGHEQIRAFVAAAMEAGPADGSTVILSRTGHGAVVMDYLLDRDSAGYPVSFAIARHETRRGLIQRTTWEDLSRRQ